MCGRVGCLGPTVVRCGMCVCGRVGCFGGCVQNVGEWDDVET